MTLDRILSIGAIFIAGAALAISIRDHSLREQQADEALRRREAALCQYAAPKLAKVYGDMLGESFDPKSFNPKTLPELVEPYEEIVTQMQKVQPAIPPR